MPEILNLALVRSSPRTSANQKKWGIFKCPFRGILLRDRHKALEAFESGARGQKYPAIAQSWRRNWGNVVPFFAYPESVRRIIYTTNAIEELNSKFQRAVRTRGHFPNDDAALKLLYLVLNQAAADWERPPRGWGEAKTQFAVVFGERFVFRCETARRTESMTVPGERILRKLQREAS